MSAHVEVEMLSAFLDGEMAPVERDRVEAHVAKCTPCRTRLEELRAVAQGLNALARPSVPRTLDLAVPVRARLGRTDLARWVLRPATGTLTLPFAIVAALAILLLVAHAAHLAAPASGERVGAASVEAIGGAESGGGAVLRYEAGAWRPASAESPEPAGRTATAADWARLRAREPGLARFAERHTLELPWEGGWVRFAPGEAPAEPLGAQADR